MGDKKRKFLSLIGKLEALGFNVSVRTKKRNNSIFEFDLSITSGDMKFDYEVDIHEVHDSFEDVITELQDVYDDYMGCKLDDREHSILSTEDLFDQERDE